MSKDQADKLAIVAGCRTPFSRAGSDLKSARATDLATHVFREILDRTGMDPHGVDEVLLGCAGAEAGEANPARVAALRAGLPMEVPAVTVMRNCASGMEAIFAANTRYRAGEGEVFLVGGAESMSNFPLMMGPKLTRMFTRLAKAKSVPQKLGAMLSFRPSYLKPRVALIEGLTDPVSGLIMGKTAEKVAQQFDISRREQDEFALQSHKRAAAAQQAGRFDKEIVPLAAPPKFPAMVTKDNGVREQQTIDALAKLRPVFDRHNGDVTVGNACQVTDGAVGMLLMPLRRAEQLGLEPMAVLHSGARVGLDPSVMGLGPAHAIPKLLDGADLKLDDVDLFEINEAFAAQVLGCRNALASDDYCRSVLKRDGAFGQLQMGKLNVNGGAIALGHPIGASGARIVLTLAQEMQSRSLQRGVASLCIGGGQGQALLLEAA